MPPPPFIHSLGNERRSQVQEQICFTPTQRRNHIVFTSVGALSTEVYFMLCHNKIKFIEPPIRQLFYLYQKTKEFSNEETFSLSEHGNSPKEFPRKFYNCSAKKII